MCITSTSSTGIRWFRRPKYDLKRLGKQYIPTLKSHPVKQYGSLEIRTYTDTDWQQLWPLLQCTFRERKTYAIDPDIEESEANRIWIEQPTRTIVAVLDGRVCGTYYIKPNYAGPGSHVCNAGYIVHPGFRGRGVGEALCSHSLEEARKLGFRAMQYNLVAATNDGAIRLWKKMGFQIVGTLPGAFNHPFEGFVDAFVMFRDLSDK